ncbi:MAG: CDF family Co(II)/Ni(II) efflux transporter DmeF [Sphingopyxis sp.]|nr:CDF family Co(II)/Ni(II) efflux transporter DmeF [Sphingopyxis sp.]
MSFDSQLGGLTHDHVFLGLGHDENGRRTLWVVAITAVMMVAEIVAGLAFNSMALLADGFHMATHAGALGIAAIAYAYARKHARNPRYSFGTGKVGDLASFASALILGFVALGIAFESAQRLIDPRPVDFLDATVVATIGLVVNIVCAVLLGGHHHGHAHDHDHHHDHAKPARHGDNNMRSAYVHVLADALTSVMAIAALLGGRYLGWVWLDPVIGIVGSVVIAVWAWTLIRDTAAVLLDSSEPALEANIRAILEAQGDLRLADLHVWRVGPAAHAAIVSVEGGDCESVRQRLTAIPEIAHLTVEAR